jgi:ferredoxin-NADP reductase
MELTLPIREVAPATPRARLLRLDLEGRSFPYAAGQGVLIGRPGQPVRRPYSLASAPHETEEQSSLDLLVAVDDAGLAGAHLGALAPGLPLVVEGPMGSFVLPERVAERHALFVAGGTGIAPLRPLLLELLRREPSVVPDLIYSARSADEFAFGAELERLSGAGHIRLHQTVTRQGPGRGWAGGVGRIDRDRLASVVRERETLCFVCGPHALVQDVPRQLQELGVLAHRIRVEEWAT